MLLRTRLGIWVLVRRRFGEVFFFECVMSFCVLPRIVLWGVPQSVLVAGVEAISCVLVE